MAINSNAMLRDKKPTSSVCSSSSNMGSCRLIKMDFAGKDIYCNNRFNKLNNNRSVISPYLASDKVQLSRVTEKKIMHKKATDFMSSFPLAVSVYKANSDEFKRPKRGSKKFKKSVLTLPNSPAPIPNTCTLSDLNDSEYLKNTNDGIIKRRKHRSVKRNKKPRVINRIMEYYDRDARYCSQLNTNLECSSSDYFSINGEGEGISKLSYESNSPAKTGHKSHDVWNFLRKLNNLQFSSNSHPTSPKRTSPFRKRKPLLSKNSNRTDTRIIETCHTEEFAYISSFDIDNKSRGSCSRSSSFDRITVINKLNEPEEACQNSGQNVLGMNFNLQGKSKNTISNLCQQKNKQQLKNNNKESQNKKKNIEILQNGIAKPETKDVGTKCDTILSNLEAFAKRDSDISLNSHGSCHGPRMNIIKEYEIGNNEVKHLNLVDSSANNKSYKTKTLVKNSNAKHNVTKLADNSGKQMSGITKVMVSKGHHTVLSTVSEIPRKGQLSMTSTKAKIPKLTQADIKRRLANMKFPIVILGNDQITNQAIHIEHYDPPQFNGLDQQIWPFMIEWTEKIYSHNIGDKENSKIVVIKSVMSKVHQTDGYPQIAVNKYMKAADLEVPLDIYRKPKSISMLKNKMFNFLQKKSTPIKVTENKRTKTEVKNKFFNRTETLKPGIEINENRRVITDSAENRLVNNSYSSIYPWPKPKKGRDFIEHIFKKIRNGVYYSVDRKEIKYRTSNTEAATQTEPNILKNVCCQNGIDPEFSLKVVLSKREDILNNILRFGNTVSALKIENVSSRQMLVKDSITNVVVQFDIQILAETNKAMRTNNSTSCIPVNVQENVFKYSTSIHNAILPAELCSIIPIMMRKILKTDNKLHLPSTTLKRIEFDKTIKSEIKASTSEISIESLQPARAIPDRIKPMLIGRFSSDRSNQMLLRSLDLCMHTCGKDYIANLCPRVALKVFWQFNLHPFMLHIRNTFNILKEKSNPSLFKHSKCLALQLYEPRNLRIIPSFGVFNFTEFMNKIFENLKVNVLFCKNSVNMTNMTTPYDDMCNSLTISSIRPKILLQSEQNKNMMIVTTIKKFTVISLFNAYNNMRSNDENVNITKTSIKKEESHITPDKTNSKLHKKPKRSLRKKSYLKCYRKCNSMSSIFSYRSTPLSRITNLDEFCQALGSISLSRVLEGCTEGKILAALAEMKNWISEITPKQALLVLLLTNKKDTKNLIRFRPVLLQGIAVNRITRAVELDTEIEVIEKENFNKISQFEGISYLPASVENQDNLFEELFWIAKTTASDYQKPFDETSEKLLKSLLEKRKKLNPSYLRVMARYLGLGLLTPPK